MLRFLPVAFLLACRGTSGTDAPVPPSDDTALPTPEGPPQARLVLESDRRIWGRARAGAFHALGLDAETNGDLGELLLLDSDTDVVTPIAPAAYDPAAVSEDGRAVAYLAPDSDGEIRLHRWLDGEITQFEVVDPIAFLVADATLSTLVYVPDGGGLARIEFDTGTVLRSESANFVSFGGKGGSAYFCTESDAGAILGSWLDPSGNALSFPQGTGCPVVAVDGYRAAIAGETLQVKFGNGDEADLGSAAGIVALEWMDSGLWVRRDDETRAFVDTAGTLHELPLNTWPALGAQSPSALVLGDQEGVYVWSSDLGAVRLASGSAPGNLRVGLDGSIAWMDFERDEQWFGHTDGRAPEGPFEAEALAVQDRRIVWVDASGALRWWGDATPLAEDAQLMFHTDSLLWLEGDTTAGGPGWELGGFDEQPRVHSGRGRNAVVWGPIFGQNKLYTVR